MGTPSHIEASTDRVLQAIVRFGKSTMANEAEITESVIRDAGRDGWNPTRETLAKLEGAAGRLEKRHGAARAISPRESEAPNPVKARRRA